MSKEDVIRYFEQVYGEQNVIFEDHPIHVYGACLLFWNSGSSPVAMRVHDSGDKESWSLVPMVLPNGSTVTSLELSANVRALALIESDQEFLRVSAGNTEHDGPIFFYLVEWTPVGRSALAYGS